MDSPHNLSRASATNLRLLVFLHAVVFVVGFSLVFIIGWGGAATLLGQAFGAYKSALGKVGGVVVILFGLSTLGAIKIPFLNYDTRPEWRDPSRNGFLASLLMGLFFAAGWTPCVGTTLGAILTMGFNQDTSTQGMVLASGYAFGLGLPFLGMGLGIDQATQFVRRFRRHMRKIQIASGVFLLLIGFMMLTNQITLIAIWAQRNGLFLDLPLGEAAAPTYLIAFLAGLISFLSPCVLPLVPAYLGYLSGHAFGRHLENPSSPN
jgi:cytochrome c-type biogenesis protein